MLFEDSLRQRKGLFAAESGTGRPHLLIFEKLLHHFSHMGEKPAWFCSICIYFDGTNIARNIANL
jgi:hypothetical protein